MLPDGSFEASSPPCPRLASSDPLQKQTCILGSHLWGQSPFILHKVFFLHQLQLWLQLGQMLINVMGWRAQRQLGLYGRHLMGNHSKKCPLQLPTPPSPESCCAGHSVEMLVMEPSEGSGRAQEAGTRCLMSSCWS